MKDANFDLGAPIVANLVDMRCLTTYTFAVY